MNPMTVADLRRALAALPDDQPVLDAVSGHSLVDADSSSAGVELLFLDATTPRPRRRAVINTVSGSVTGSLLQVGGDHTGDIRL